LLRPKTKGEEIQGPDNQALRKEFPSFFAKRHDGTIVALETQRHDFAQFRPYVTKNWFWKSTRSGLSSLH